MSDSREQFEAWYLSAMDNLETFPLEFPGGPYVSQDLDLAWASWQASRQALEVALPSRSDIKYMEYFPDVEGGSFNERAYLNDFLAAIEAAGVRVNP